ncbi:MAG: xanthine dehydrogenase family protein molybdopterin-binding subunit [Xanthobacteraceae bacterium]
MAPKEPIRRDTFPFGISSVSLAEIKRQVPVGEASPLAPNDRLAVIGKRVPRINGRAKVTGAARFTVDIKLPGMLHARVLRSPHPHARIISIDTRAAESHPKVRAVHVITDIVGRAIERTPEADRAAGAVRMPRALYVGAPIAAIAATTPDAAEAAVGLIKIEYEILPFVVDMDEARKPDAPVVFRSPVVGFSFGGGVPTGSDVQQHGNARGPAKAGGRGDVKSGFAEADVIVEGEFRTQVQTHCCLETHAVVADWRADGLTVYISTQFTAGVRNELADAFGLPRSRVRVVVDAMGGGFGSKSSAGNYARAAVALSRAAGAPVRLVHDRREEQLDSGNRPGTFQRLKIGARKDGPLSAISLYTYGTAGTALGAGVGNIAQAMYDCPNFDIEQYDIFINAGPGCPMRGPGNVPGAFALEQSIDELAEKLEIDPLALRDRIDASAVRREERRIGAERIGWNRRHAAGADSGTIKRGIGVAQSLWGANVQTNASCEVRLLRDGSVEVLSSVQDIGTGIGTVLAQVVAEEFRLRVEDITVRIGDTDFPAGPPSYGSRTTASITPPVRNAAHKVKRMLFEVVGPHVGAAAEDLVVRNGRVVVPGDPARSMSFREAAAMLRTDQISAFASRADDYGGFRREMMDAALAQNDLGGVQFAEVAVDIETGIVRVERFVAVQDCGRPMNPLTIESQVQGGVLQGISYALFEDRILDQASGHMLNADLEHYKIIGSRETPEIEVVVLENYQGQSATDAYGIAEPASIATAPAVANAVYNAIGVRLRHLPMTPAAVLSALGRIPRGS